MEHHRGFLNKLQIYDIVGRTWRLGAPIPVPFEWSSELRGLALDGKFFVMHTYFMSRRVTGMLVYDPESDSWTVEPREPWREERMRMLHACVHNGRMVVFTERGVFERATDGSWSSSGWRHHDESPWIVSESVLLG